jgi:hydroxyethylthiazole kinase-like uncharacterized protein yjeF
MHREPHSHKGENGKVAIIGGSRFMHGAPIMTALAAEASGADLLYLFVPPKHEDVTKQASYNFQVRTFKQDEIGNDDTGPVLQLLASMDCAVIGPGLPRDTAALNIMQKIITGAPCPLVIDASALQKGTLEWVHGKSCVLTPHLGELERMGIAADDIANIAQRHRLTILLKDRIDRIADHHGDVTESDGGNAGLTVGGTGDALAGLTSGLIAQKLEPGKAALLASRVIKRCGEILSEQQGNAYTTRDVIELIPLMINELSQ